MHVKKINKVAGLVFREASNEEEFYEVIQVGEGCGDCRVGDFIILHGLGSGGMFVYDGVTHYVCREQDVICIMNRNK